MGQKETKIDRWVAAAGSLEGQVVDDRGFSVDNMISEMIVSITAWLKYFDQEGDVTRQLEDGTILNLNRGGMLIRDQVELRLNWYQKIKDKWRGDKEVVAELIGVANYQITIQIGTELSQINGRNLLMEDRAVVSDYDTKISRMGKFLEWVIAFSDLVPENLEDEFINTANYRYQYLRDGLSRNNLYLLNSWIVQTRRLIDRYLRLVSELGSDGRKLERDITVELGNMSS